MTGMIRDALHSDAPETIARAKRLYRERRTRAAVFDGDEDLFGEPAWDILLDLFVAGSEHRPVRVSDSCAAAAVPRTTALRWLQTLTRRELIEREGDPLDARSSLVRLSPKGAELIGRYLARIA